MEDALVAFLRAQEQVLLLDENVAALEESLNLVLIQFKEGTIDFTAVFVLQGTLTES